MNFSRKTLDAGLYFVATPIGNARDITLRGLDLLASADIITAEDTRTARKLMDIHAIPLAERPLIALHDHSKAGVLTHLCNLAQSGKSIVYVSEAGTPLISDPGFELAGIMIKNNIPVISAPGPSAVLTALTIAGLPTDRFCFIGFLPSQKEQRCSALSELKDLDFTTVFYESPKRINDMLTNLCDVFGAHRQIAVCRELTKKFEEVIRGSVEDVLNALSHRTLKGEIVVVVDRAGDTQTPDADIETALYEAMKTMRIKDAATAVAGAFKLSKRDVYQHALRLNQTQGPSEDA